MNILVTGANGLVGNELCRQLAQNGTNRIFGLVRTPHKAEYASLVYLQGDILNAPLLEELIEQHKIEVIIHTAAVVSFSPKDKKDLFETNVTGTANLINAALHNTVKKFIHLSSVAAIGKPEEVLDTKEPVQIDENFKWVETPLNSNYARSKYLAELEVWRGQAEGLSTVILNPSTILGSGDLKRSSTQLFNYVYKGNKFLTGGSINYIDLNDLVHVIIACIEKPVQNQRYIVSAGHIPYSEFFGLMAKNMGKKAPDIKLGKWLVEALWRMEALRSVLTGSKPLINRETAISARSNIHFVSAKLKNEFGLEFTPIEETISRICRTLDLHA